jgi:hypothetical protein
MLQCYVLTCGRPVGDCLFGAPSKSAPRARAPLAPPKGRPWIYHMAKPSQAFFRCLQADGWATISASLQGAGVIQHAASCHVSVAGIQVQLFPRLNGQTRFPLTALSRCTPELPALTTAHELQTLETIAETKRIDELVSAIRHIIRRQTKAHWYTSMHPYIPHHHQSDWYIATLTPVGICVILYLVLHFSPLFLIACLKRCQRRSEPENGTPDVPGSHSAGVQPKPRQPIPQVTREESSEELEPPSALH